MASTLSWVALLRVEELVEGVGWQEGELLTFPAPALSDPKATPSPEQWDWGFPYPTSLMRAL